MRTKNSIKSIAVSMGLGLIAIVISFIAQRFFIEYLNVDYLGVNGLFTSVISMLAVVELGLGSAIIYHLYRPLADKDTSRINILMAFYKKGYRAIAFIVLAIGLALMPFLPLIVQTDIPVNLNIVYLLFIGDAVFSYLLSYKRSILYADQKNYVINAVRIGSLITLNILQILILIATQNYYLYLILKISMTIAENAVLHIIVNKKYPLLEKTMTRLDGETKKDIFKKAKGLLFHKVGSFLVLGTDNILISIFFGIKMVGLYSNYLLIIMALQSIFSQLATAITASIGNLLLTNDPGKHYSVFRRLNFATFWLATFVAISFFVVSDSFIALWIGKEFVFPLEVLVALTISLYLTFMRSPFHSFKTAAGIFHEDRHIPLIEAGVNIVASIIFLQFFGLAGVFIGSICSVLVLHLYSYPKYVYINIFKRSYERYYREFMVYTITAFALAAITYFTSRSIVFEDNFTQLIFNTLVCLIVPNISFYLLYRSTDEFTYYKGLIGKVLRKLKRKNIMKSR